MDKLFQWGAGVAAYAVVGLLGLIIVLLYLTARPTIGQFGVRFLWGAVWDPNLAPLQFGALPFVSGTLTTAAIGLLLGVPLSLGIAIFLSDLAPGWLRVPLGTVIELLAAVPSVIYGLWGFYVLVPVMRGTIEPALQSVLGWTPLFAGAPLGRDKLTAGVILAIMVIPTISAVSRDAFRSIPVQQREAALSLGATQWEAIRIGVLRGARSGVFGAVILGLGRAIGETMAVTMTIGNNNNLSASLFAPGQTIASLIANEFTEASPIETSALIELGLILLAVSLLINLVARILLRRLATTSEEAP